MGMFYGNVWIKKWDNLRPMIEIKNIRSVKQNDYIFEGLKFFFEILWQIFL